MQEIFSVRVDSELMSRFKSAAILDTGTPDVNVSEVIRDLMKGYVEKTSKASDELFGYISEEEKKERKYAYDFAIANVALEGFELNQEAKDRMMRYVNGEISEEELLKVEPPK